MTKIIESDVLDAIQSVTYHTHRQTTVAFIDLRNGFTVLGSSACVDPDTFDAEVGRQLAFEDAKNKVWELLGFDLATRMHDGMLVVPSPYPEAT